MKKIKLFAISAFSLLTIMSCSDFEDTNVDPNAAVSVPASTLLTTAQYRLYNMLNGVGLNADFGLLMVQQWAQNEYTEDSRYNFDINSFNGTFGSLYTDIAKELQSAKALVEAQDIDAALKSNQKYIIDIMTAQVFAVLTDGFGDVPYSEALGDVSFPKYDAQSEIYTGILSTLDAAASGLNESSASFPSGDALFSGDVSKWKKFANSLMLRYALRIVDADATMAQTYVTKAINGGVFTSNADNANFNYPDVDARANPLYRNFSPQVSNRDDYCVSELLVTTLNGMNDPRLDKFAKPASGGTIVGMPYGLNDNDATALKPTTSRPNDAVREATTPFHVITYSEVEFLLAEAYERGLASGNAQTAYDNGVTASMNQWGITDGTAISTYISNNAYDSANWKVSIGTQKWIALYMNGFEAWNEWRRLDQPSLTATPNGVINTIPVRLTYPLSETQNNSEQLSQVTSNPADLTTKVWWDKN
ncbi:SusD/RagB family nutrient-binding outer membrane lipoprotein [Tenacibaculum xiamenense]|uniref:SusD/RagB family nutrient-binding outer membrane lipoprotein n=1 Tax=Tenacibaculum xiamenense TaxID=1261553 RepID=UPI00389446D5